MHSFIRNLDYSVDTRMATIVYKLQGQSIFYIKAVAPFF